MPFAGHATAIAAGVNHGLALTAAGKVVAWGSNDYGQRDVPGSLRDRTVTAIAAGRQFSLALTSDGKLTSWGSDWMTDTSVPASLADKTVVAIAASYSHALAVTSDGQVTAWGSNTHGESDVPAGLTDVASVAAGTFTSVALTREGKVVVWGTNDYRQRDLPAILAGKTVTSIAAGWTTVGARTSDGMLVMWGEAMPGGEVIHHKHVSAFALGVDHVLAVIRNLHPLSPPTLGTTHVGRAIHAHHGHWTDPVASYAYTWKVDGVPVGHHDTYTPTAAQYGKQLTLTVTATATDADQGRAHVTTQPVPIEKGDFTAVPAPTVTGVRELGRPLTVELTAVHPHPDSVTFTWKRRDVVVGHGVRYTPSGDDFRHSLTVVATVHKHGFHEAHSRVGTGPIRGCTTYC